MFFKGFLFLILSLCVALANPSQSGRTAGETFLRQYGGGEKNRANKAKETLIDPATHSRGGEKPYITPTGQSLYADPVLCGQGSTSNKVRFLEASVNPSERSSVRIDYAIDPYSDHLSRSFSYSGRYLCVDGYCNEYSNGKYRNCKKLRFSGGEFSFVSAGSLDVCVDPQLQPQPPTFYAGKVVELLLDFYRTSGKPLRQMDIQTEGNRAIYFGGKPECRAGIPQFSNNYSNPYTLRDEALYYYFSCNPREDPTCLATRSMLSTGTSTSRSTCTIERRMVLGQRVCVPGQKIYPDGRNEGRSVCGGRDFSSFQASLWLECNPDGKGYTLKGWGFWEGAPCGRSDFYPPEIQFSKEVPYGRSFSELLAGRISVNKKVSDASNQCIEPYEVRVSGEGNPNSMTYRVRILGAPTCNSFTFSNIKPVKEDIVSNCPNMENCKVINEWWEDANGQRIEVIKSGAPVKQLTGCEEVLWSNEERAWVSHNSGQSPPNNCNYPPKTCRDGECRQWWKKIREYECGSRTNAQRPNAERLGNVLGSMQYDSQTGRLSFTDRTCRSSGTCERVSKNLRDYVCSLDGRAYRMQDTCLSNCYASGFCERTNSSYRCVNTGQVFESFQSCETLCQSTGECSRVYYCPLNLSRHTSQSECLSNCNNCQQSGSCSSETIRNACSQVMAYAPICPSGYTWNASMRMCIAPATCPPYHQCVNVCEYYQGQPTSCQPFCFTGRLNFDTDRCEINTCPQGFVFDLGLHMCVSPMTYYIPFMCLIHDPGNDYGCSDDERIEYLSRVCPDMRYTGIIPVGEEAVKCYINFPRPNNYSLVNGVYIAQVNCPAGGVYDPNLNLCVSTQNPCPQGQYEPSLNACVYTPSPVSSLDRISDVYSLYANTQCPASSCTSYYKCPLTGQYHTSLSQCKSQCVRNVYRCSIGGEYSTQEECQRQCRREVSGCCELKGFCSANNMLYDINACANYCSRRHQCVEESQYRCVLTGMLYTSHVDCDRGCRQGGNCQERSRELELYRCSTTLAEYESQLSCQNACLGGGCSDVNMSFYAGRPDTQTCDKKYCVVRQGREVNMVECLGESCPVGSGRMVEQCKCADELRSGFGLGLSILGALNGALKDISCR